MKKRINKLFHSEKFRKGSYSTIVIIVAAAILVGINIMIRQLPSKIKSADLSSEKIYNIGETSENIIKSMNHDVNIIVVAENGSVDKRITNILQKYKDMSDHINIEYKDPALYPSVLTKYSTQANSIVFECKDTDRTKQVSFDDIIVLDSYYAMYGYNIESEFDGEGQITAALSYITSDNNKKIYELTGHNEASIDSTITDEIEKSNLSFADDLLSLLTEGKIPDDCDTLICNQPGTDLAVDELESINEYLDNGGHMILILASTKDELKNFNSLMDEYGISKLTGYIADTSRYNAYDQSPYSIFPEYSTGDITGSLSHNDNSELTLLRNSLGLKITETEGVTVDEFLKTSENGAIATYDTDYESGTYTLAARAEKTGSLTVYGGSSIIDSKITSQYSVKNVPIFINSITAGFTDVDNISIDPVNIGMTYNTFTNTKAVTVIIIAIIPLGLIIFGLNRWLKRRKL